MNRLIAKIGKLKPSEFENLVYDMLVRRGLRNVRWRTPGADGGRDIEGEAPVQDFAGDVRVERWYVECKRYRSAIDWPTVFGKLAYAKNHAADYLLVVTTSRISPACRSEISRWNTERQRPFIRDWSGQDLEHMVPLDPLLMVKYGLSAKAVDRERASLPLLNLVAKTIHQIYGEESLSGTVSFATEFAASTAEYAASWSEESSLDSVRRRERFMVDRDIYPWVDIVGIGPRKKWSPYALRAVFSAVRFYRRAERMEIEWMLAGRSEVIRITPVRGGALIDVSATLDLICRMANLEWRTESNGIIVSSRAVR